MVRKIHIDQNTFEKMIGSLYNLIKEDGTNFDFVVGIAEGGLPISSALSYLLKKPHKKIKISLYETNSSKKRSIPHIEILDNIDTNSHFLLVDDIVDSGETIKHFQDKTQFKQGKHFKIASLHWYPHGDFKIIPDFYSDIKHENTWIIYPWEIKS